MKEISLFTKTKITAGRVSQKIIDAYPFKKRIVQNDEGELFLGYFPREFYIVYADSCPVDDPDCLFEEDDLKKIPFDNPVVNEVFYHYEEVAKFVVKVVLAEYPELYISDDEGDVMSAAAYLERKES